MGMRINYKAEFEGFRKTAQDAEWYPAIAVISDAEINANDTYGELNENNESFWFECAYGSICETPDFNENERVRWFFSKLGYSW